MRPRPERTSADIAIANEEIGDCKTIGDFLGDNEDMHSSTKNQRKGGRRHTKMGDIIKEPGSMPMPKIIIELNDDGQPIGENYRKLSCVLGVQTRKLLPVAYSDWRLMDADIKMTLWDDIKSLRLDEFGEANQHVQGEEDGCAEDNIYYEEANHEANKQAAALAASPAMNITASPRNNQQVVAVAASPTASLRNDVQRFSKHALPGNEVILFAMSSDEKVAKATVVSANPNNKIDGVALGKRFCEVNVDVVLKRDTLVPRPYADIKTLGDALNMLVAWPYNRLKRCSQRVAGSQRSSQGVVGSSQRC